MEGCCELGKMRMEEAVVYFEIISPHLCGDIEESFGKPPSG
jgi:hypothetical protein